MPHVQVAKLLAQQIGLDPETVGLGLIRRAMHARMSSLGVGSPEEYLVRLRGCHDELQALVEEVVVPESWFFRDDCPFALFRDYVRNGWIADPSRAPLRILSIPCAAGEEPYSIALALIELGLPSSRFVIDAVDVSTQALERARRGVYGRSAFRGNDLGFRTRFFHEHAQGFELDEAVRNLVRFRRGNLLAADVLKDEAPYDVILCRNLLIYFDDDARRRAVDSLDRLLAHPGLLFLGHAERLASDERRFEPVPRAGCFAYQRVEKKAPVERVVLPGAAMSKPKRSPIVVTRSQPLPLPTEPRKPVVSSALASLEQAAALAGQGKNADAAALCESVLRENGANISALFLLGMIRQSLGAFTEAEASLRKVVYLDPQHDEALLALALIAERRGDHAAAAGFRRRAERAHRTARKGTP